MNTTKIKENKNNIIILIILLSWAHQWLSIGSFINTNYKDFQLNSILGYRNQSLFIFAINLIIFFFNKKKNIKNNIFFYLFLIPISYLLGFVNLFIDNHSGKDIFFFWHLTFVLQMINTFLILNNFSKIDEANESLFIKINLLLIFIYTVIVFITYNFSLKVEYNLNFLNVKISTNINAICRMLSLINIFITCNYFIKKKRITLLILIFIINFLIISSESRQGLVLISVQLLLIIFYCSRKNIIKTMFKYLILLIIIPICLSLIYKNNTINNRLFLFQGELKRNNLTENFNNITNRKGNLNILNIISTGRFDKWIFVSTHIIDSKIKNILFGNGPEFDRKIISTRGNDISNGLIYLLLCGGLFGLFSFFIIIKRNLNIILKTFYNKKNLDKDVYFCFSICCIISLGLRSLVENGFLVYGVDFLLVTSSFFYVIKKLKLI